MPDKIHNQPNALERLIQSFDAFAEDVPNRYEGNRKLGSKCGGTMTIIIYLWLCFVMYEYTNIILRNETPTITQNTIHYEA